MPKRVIPRICPNCNAEAYTVDLIAGITSAGTFLGETLYKCRSGCTPNDVLSSEPYRANSGLSDAFFLEMVSYARSIGKVITMADKGREARLFINKRVS